jgi:hypothetical protein
MSEWMKYKTQTCICYAGDYPEYMRILIEKVLKLLKIRCNFGRFQLLSLSHLACASIGFGYDGLSSPEKSE